VNGSKPRGLDESWSITNEDHEVFAVAVQESTSGTGGKKSFEGAGSACG
jgi:hypothetical protein